MILGVHVPALASPMTAMAVAAELGVRAFEMTTRSSDRWFTSPLPPDEVVEFRNKAGHFASGSLLAHASRLINPATLNPTTHARSMDALFDELMRAEALGLAWVVLHPGNHGGKGEQRGLRRIAHSLNTVLERIKGFRVGILLETMPRMDAELGYLFEDLAFVRQRVKQREKVGICIDTSHIFAAGYDIRDLKAYLATVEEIERHIGLRHVKALHLSDSKLPLASQCCSHTHLGEGEIGLSAFAFIVNDTRFRDIPLILATPRDRDLKADARNLTQLLQLEGAVTV